MWAFHRCHPAVAAPGGSIDPLTLLTGSAQVHTRPNHSPRSSTMRAAEGCADPLWLLLVEDENGKLQDGDLSANQQRPAADASRCSRVSGWHLCSPDGLTRGSGGYGAPTSCAAKNASRGSSPEAHHLRGLTFADHLE